MVDQLFGSKTRVKLLKLFHTNPNRSFYVREITRKIDEQINSVRRELSNLLSIGIITSDTSNNRLYYEVNKDYEYYDALSEMFGGKSRANKKVSTQKVINKPDEEESIEESVVVDEQDLWKQTGNVIAVVYSGVYTRDESSLVDILVIGDVLASKVEAVVSDLEKEKNKELRFAVIEKDEWEYRRKVRDRFYRQIMSAKNQVVIDKYSIFIKK